ncbi:MAG: glutamate 5-kinase [Candidatus Pacebacteria bacterium]|nr:glutamate 5-kinase [Candidatus Paceibacterota bacterium]
MKRIAVKIGSAVLSGPDGIKHEVIANLVEDVAGLVKQGHQVVIISSGAVILGKTVSQFANPTFAVNAPDRYDSRLLREQILASVGQPKLMALYSEEFAKHNLSCGQLLTTRSDFADRRFYLSLRVVTGELLRYGVIPIFNENDVLSPEELDFSDNDQLALVIAAMISADELILLTNVAGVYDRPPQEEGAKLIPEIADVSTFMETFEAGKHTGKGGIQSKLLCAEKVTSLGIPMHIAAGTEKTPLMRIIGGEKLGTFFPTTAEKEEALKSWLLTAAVGAGKIVVSTYLADRLREGGTQNKSERRTPSVLLAGIEEVRGEFGKRDVVEIIDDDGILLGRGLTRHTSHELREKVDKYRILPEAEKEQLRGAAVIAIHANDFVFAK